MFVNFNLRNGHIYAEYDEAGQVSGYFAGAVPLEDFSTITELNDIGEVAGLLSSLLEYAADIDLDQDGTCDAISVVFEFSGVNAFFYE